MLSNPKEISLPHDATKCWYIKRFTVTVRIFPSQSRISHLAIYTEVQPEKNNCNPGLKIRQFKAYYVKHGLFYRKHN